MDIEVLKQKYAKLWQECNGDEKLFLKLARLKEREKRLQEELKKKSKIERRREARALIIFAKLVITQYPQLAKEILSKYVNEFQQKERSQTIDYSHYIENLLK